MKRILLIFYIFIFAVLSLTAQAEQFSVGDLYELALENSISLTEKTVRAKAASYRVMEAKSKGAPVFSFQSALSYIHNPDTITVEAGSFGQLPDMIGGQLLPDEDTTFSMSGNSYYDFKLIMDQPIFTWGKVYNALQATKEGAAAANIDSAKTRDLLKNRNYD